MKANKQQIALRPGETRELVVLQDQPDTVALETEWDISLAEGATLTLVFVSLRGSIRNRIAVSLDGPHADCRLAGLYLPSDAEEMDFDIEMVHRVPACRSTQLFKSVVSGQGVAHFDGLIRVVPDAQQTEAYQANHNLLASDAARAFTRPQLEIYADDVKCSHGATVGRLNPDELFYMRTRGIPLAEAQLLQQLAFANEVLAQISSKEQREDMQARVEKRLREL